jgi:hypothetical protein
MGRSRATKLSQKKMQWLQVDVGGDVGDGFIIRAGRQHDIEVERLLTPI